MNFVKILRFLEEQFKSPSHIVSGQNTLFVMPWDNVTTTIFLKEPETLFNEFVSCTLEDALEQNITHFLLELGSGFAFIGRQKEIIVAGNKKFR